MQPFFQELLGDRYISSAKYYVAGAVAAATLFSFLKQARSPLRKVPTVGSQTWLGSFVDGIKFFQRSTEIIQEGYAKHKGTPFKVSSILGWIIIVSGRRQVEEFCKIRDDEMNLSEAINEFLKVDHPSESDSDTHHDAYNVAVLRAKLTRNLPEVYADMKDEVVIALDELLNLQGHEWKSIVPLGIVQQVISRTSNRVLVGLPLCRNPDWVKLNIVFTMDIFKLAAMIFLFPKFMTPVIVWIMTTVSRHSKRGMSHVGPIVEARRKHFSEYDRPNDFLSWLLEGSQGAHRSVRELTHDLLGINFAAIHTTSQAFTLALYNLAANPEYLQALRDEVEPIIEEEGWSKASVSKMYKVDSFMKETKRMVLPGFTSVLRKAVKDVTMSDGTFVPKGTFVALATQAIQLDDEFYENATSFNPFRFANMRSTCTEDSEGLESLENLKYHFTSTNTEYLPFGHGRNACPGRFFAASLLNTLVAYAAISYDIKLEKGTIRPGTEAGRALDSSMKVMIRKRKVA